jgi:hypothetical protein
MADEKDKRIKARQGDTLCIIAIRNGGFLNCDALRDHEKNKDHLVATLKKGTYITVPPLRAKGEKQPADKKHKIKKKNAPLPYIRFVHGTPNLPWRNDPSLAWLNVTNYPADKGGRYPTGPGGPNNYAGLPAFPSGFGFDNDGHHDEDTFKIEVVDPHEGANKIKVKVIALKPVYKNGKVDSYTTFAAGDPDAAKRELEVECERVKAGSKVFRSRYMRLVTDVNDFDSIKTNKQALLVSPMADGNDGANDEVEVLDQRIRAEYELSFCKATKGPKCKIVKHQPVGRRNRQRRVKTAVHILRTGRGSPGVITIQQARKSLLNFVRELYAQAELSVKLVKPKVQLINPPKNMITISNEQARRAQGGKTISVRVRVDANDNTVSITTVAGHTPRQTAQRLAKEIRKVCNVKAKVSRNPPIVGRALGSADILVGDPDSQNVRLNVVTANDARQAVDIARIVGTQIDEYEGYDSHVGTLDERVLVKNYDSGRNRIDTFIVGTLDQHSFGEAFTPNKRSAKNQRPISNMVNTVLIKAQTQQSRTHAHTTIPHEWAHVLMDAGHIPNPTTELITAGAPVGNNEQVVNGPKRIGDPPGGNAFRVSWDDGPKGNPVRRLRSKNPSCLTKW